MKRRFLLLCLAALLPWNGKGADTSPAAAIVEEEGFVAASDARGPRIRLAIWPDGRIIWESQPGRFLTGHVDAPKIQALLDRFTQSKVFDAESFRHSWIAPDAGYTLIWLQAGEQHTRLELWKEDPDDKSADYRKFIQVWKDLRAATSALIPKKGKLYTGSTKLRLP